MTKRKNLKGIVEIDWGNRVFSYQLSDEELGQVQFLELRQSRTDWFRYCCSIAIAQDYHTDDEGVTAWTGGSDDFISKVFKKFGWRAIASTRNSYWTHYFSKGSKANFPCFTETFSISSDGEKKQFSAELLFNKIDGYVFGDQIERSEGTYKLWRVNFINTDEEFTIFQQQVHELLRVGVLTPPVIPPKRKPGLFKPIENILRMDMSSKGLFKEPVWFRSSGPLAIDFQRHRVYMNKKKVAALKNHLLSHQVSMMENPAATGKTVLVRSLALELYEDKGLEIFYFDCDSNRDFLPAELADEIGSTEGIFIIENMHLEPRKLGPVISKLQNLTNRHILFTSRPLFREREYLSPEELKEIHFFPQTELFEDADKIIDLYFSSELEHRLSLKKRNNIKKITSDNYKMLGYALEGYAKKRGRGEPEEWLEDGVKRELQCLEYVLEGPDGPNPIFPEIMLALSPLYMNEVLTEESFLRDMLHFDKDELKALNTLVELGEVTSQRARDGHTFYGLPHSVQAKACWKYGITYRNRRALPKYEAFIYDYARSDVTNGLRAIVRASKNISNRVLRCLDVEGKLSKVIASEHSMDGLIAFVEVADQDIIAKNGVLTALARRIEICDNSESAVRLLSGVCRCCSEEMTQQLWELVNHDKLRAKIVQTGEALHVVNRLCSFKNYNSSIGKKLCGILNVDDLVSRLNTTDDLPEVGWCCSLIIEANGTVGQKVWQHLDKDNLAAKLTQAEYLHHGWMCIDNIHRVDPDKAYELCELLNICDLVEALDKSEDIYNLTWYMYAIVHANKKVGQKLCRLLDKTKLAYRLSRDQRDGLIAQCIKSFQYASRTEAHKLCGLVELEELATHLNESAELSTVTECFSLIYGLDDAMGDTLWKLLDKDFLAKKLHETNFIILGKEVIDFIYYANKDYAREFCRLFDLEELAAIIVRPDQFWQVADFISSLYNANNEKGRELWDIINKEILATQLSWIEDIRRGQIWLYRIYGCCPEMLEELCGHFDLPKLSSILRETDDISNKERYLDMIGKANKQVERKLLKLINK